MGPAPMMRMVEMSVLLGIRSHGQGTGHKKRARMPRVPQARARSAKVEAGFAGQTPSFVPRSRSQFMNERMIFTPNRPHFGGSCAAARLLLARGVVFRPDSAAAKGPQRLSQPAFWPLDRIDSAVQRELEAAPAWFEPGQRAIKGSER